MSVKTLGEVLKARLVVLARVSSTLKRGTMEGSETDDSIDTVKAVHSVVNREYSSAVSAIYWLVIQV